jgi:hypothetical protein
VADRRGHRPWRGPDDRGSVTSGSTNSSPAVPAGSGRSRADVAVWVHFGANIGAVGGDLSILSASDDLRALAAAELVRAGQPADRIVPKTLVPRGETRDIHRAGGRYVTLVGSNPLFHLPQDRWPHAVDPAAVARIAAAAAGLVVGLTR